MWFKFKKPFTLFIINLKLVMLNTSIYILIIIFFKNVIHSFLERGEEREKERERNIHVLEKHWLVASSMPPAGDLAHNPGMCPDWESNQWPFCCLLYTSDAADDCWMV